MDRLKNHPVGKFPYRLFSIAMVLLVIVYIAMFQFVDAPSAWTQLSELPFTLTLSILGLSIFSYGCRALRWWLFLRSTSTKISPVRHVLIYLGGFALTTSPGKAGEMIRSIYLKPLGIGFSKSIAAFVSERLLDVLAVTCISMIGLSMLEDRGSWFAVAGCLVLIVFLVLRSPQLESFLRLFPYRPAKLALKFQTSVEQFLSITMLLKVLPLSFAAWTAQGIGLALLVKFFGYDINPILVIGIYNLSMLAGAASFIPGGLGATEAAITLLLGLQGVEASDGLTIAMTSRILTLWLAISMGFVSLLLVIKQSKGLSN